MPSVKLPKVDIKGPKLDLKGAKAEVHTHTHTHGPTLSAISRKSWVLRAVPGEAVGRM